MSHSHLDNLNPELFQVFLNEYEEIRVNLEEELTETGKSELYTDLTKLIIKIADYVEAISEKCEKAGKKFVFVIAPNKMEIYGEYMPYYYVENCPDGNYEKLIKELSSRKVAYTDLKKLFKEDNTYSGVELYHKLDSHWNNLGASLAYMEIMDNEHIKIEMPRDIGRFL